MFSRLQNFRDSARSSFGDLGSRVSAFSSSVGSSVRDSRFGTTVRGWIPGQTHTQHSDEESLLPVITPEAAQIESPISDSESDMDSIHHNPTQVQIHIREVPTGYGKTHIALAVAGGMFASTALSFIMPLRFVALIDFAVPILYLVITQQDCEALKICQSGISNLKDICTQCMASICGRTAGHERS